MVRRSLAAAALAALVAPGIAGAQSAVPTQVKGAIVSIADKKLTLKISDKSTESWPLANDARFIFVKRLVKPAEITAGDSAHVFVGKDGAIHMVQLLAMKKPAIAGPPASAPPSGKPAVTPPTR